MELQIYLWGDPGQYGTYQAAIRRAGGEPLLSRDVGAASGCAGLLLPGGGDVAPWRYGQRNFASRSIEPERDAAEWALLMQFAAAGKPVLGICRGMQSINVFFGGTLLQDLPGHAAASGADRLHKVWSAPSPLWELWGETCITNSAHHQAVDHLGQRSPGRPMGPGRHGRGPASPGASHLGRPVASGAAVRTAGQGGGGGRRPSVWRLAAALRPNRRTCKKLSFFGTERERNELRRQQRSDLQRLAEFL